MKLKANKGFTLVELIVVIAVIAVLSVLAALAFTNMREGARDAAEAQDAARLVSLIDTVEGAGVASRGQVTAALGGGGTWGTTTVLAPGGTSVSLSITLSSERASGAISRAASTLAARTP